MPLLSLQLNIPFLRNRPQVECATACAEDANCSQWALCPVTAFGG